MTPAPHATRQAIFEWVFSLPRAAAPPPNDACNAGALSTLLGLSVPSVGDSRPYRLAFVGVSFNPPFPPLHPPPPSLSRAPCSLRLHAQPLCAWHVPSLARRMRWGRGGCTVTPQGAGVR